MDNSNISIIIPTLNEEQNLDELLPYLQSIIKENTEIIVADACLSEDGTEAICERYEAMYVTCVKCSRAGQMNTGAKKASGDILYFLHADARPPKSLELDINDTLSNGYDFGLFSYKFNSDRKLLSINSQFTKRKGLFAGGGDQSIFMRRETFESLGMFDTSYCIMEDFKLFHDAKKMDLKYKIVPNDVMVSARKYERNSYLRVNFSNLIAFSMYHMGMKPEKIKKTYSYLLK